VKSTQEPDPRDGKTPQRKTNGDDLRRALNWIISPDIFAEVRLHGNVKWKPLALVCLAIFWVWSAQPGLVEAAKEAIATVAKLFGSEAVAVTSYQALTTALVRYTPQLLPALWTRIQSLMLQSDPVAGRVGKWLPLAVDGSRLSVPRTKPNEEQFNKPKEPRGKKKSAAKKRSRHAQRKRPKSRSKSHYHPQAVGPQMWLTLLWHIGLRLPWCWKLGPSYASERAHLATLLHEQRFPEGTLFCGDAGFVGYEFWRSILDHGHSFLMRVGGNVRLLKGLGVIRQRGDMVYCWPDEVAKKNQPPLVLRLLRFHDGRGEVYLVTNLLDDTELTAQQASLIYRGRWGIELQFRALKQTYGRAKLRARTPEIAAIELHWSLLGLTMLQLLALKEQTRAGEPADKTSLAAVLRIIRSMIGESSETRGPSASLPNRLRRATTDSYQRQSKKQSRNYPRRKEEPHTGPPIILAATAEQRKKARKLLAAQRAA
jgi:hypothetical protein